MRIRDIKKNFYLSEEENTRLKNNCEKTGLSESSYL